MSVDATLACEPNALAPEQHERWVELSKLVYGAIEEIRELTDGYAARLPSSSDMLLLLAEDLTLERLCCPFMRFTVEIEPRHGPFWLHLTGPAGVKDFLRIAFEGADLIDARVASAAGFHTSDRRDVTTVPAALVAISEINAQFAGSKRSS
jgi:hypothetical protein